MAKRTLFGLLTHISNAGLTLTDCNGDVHFFGDKNATLQANIHVVSPAFYSRVLKGGSIAAGESYMDGQWDSTRLTNLIGQSPVT